LISCAGGLLDTARWRVIENCICAASVPSTNRLARELIDMSFEEGQQLRPTALIADAQPEAYGRNRRAWQAPSGKGLYLTIVRRTAEAEPLSVVPIAVARWAGEVLNQQTGASVELKWPNDLYVGRRKVAGVIAESSTQGADTYLAIGIGINVAGRANELSVPHATTLEEETGRPTAPTPLLQALLDRFDRELAHPHWADEVRQWERASLHRPGDRLTVRRDGEGVTGEYLGLDPSGFLRLRTPSGEAIIPSGEVAEW